MKHNPDPGASVHQFFTRPDIDSGGLDPTKRPKIVEVPELTYGRRFDSRPWGTILCTVPAII